MPNTYLNFDLLIEERTDHYSALVHDSPGGQARQEFDLPISELDLENLLLRLFRSLPRKTRGLDSPEVADARAFGQQLFDAVFSAEVLSIFRRSLDEAERRETGLRLRLRFGDAWKLHNLPWELMFDRSSGSFLALSDRTPLLRYADLTNPVLPLSVFLPLRVLVVLPSPSDYEPLDVEREWNNLGDALKRHVSDGTMELVRLESPTLAGLQQALRRDEYHVMHFVGHGGFDPSLNDGSLVLEDPDGRGSALDGQSLGVLLHDQQSLRLVTLVACEGARTSSTDPFAVAAQSLVRRGIPAVIATQFEISDQAAMTLSQEFYGALIEGFPVDTALAEARKAVYLGVSGLAWAAPALHTSLPDVRVFEIQLHPKASVPSGAPSQRAVDVPATEQVIRPSRQDEANIRLLEACVTAEDIASAHRKLTVPESRRDALSTFMRTFAGVSQDVQAALAQDTAYTQREALGGAKERLDGLYLDLTVGVQAQGDEAFYVPVTEQLQPISARWLEIVSDRIRSLAETTEQLQEIDSPYIVGVPLGEQQQVFIGRSDISTRIQNLLRDRGSPSLLLYGQRRMGKTSLLYNLGRLLPTSIVPLLVDLQGPPAQSESSAGFLYQLAAAMTDSARRQRDVGALPPSRESFSGDPFSRFYEWLDEFDHAIQGRTALLMLDEFEALDRAFTAGRLDGDEILSMLRHLIQHRPQFKVLLAGSHTLDEFERWSSYLINVQVVKVGYLREEEARLLVEAPVPGFALRYDPIAASRVLDLTRCHPFLLQLLCAEIVVLKNEQPPARRRQATLEDVEEAVPRALQSGTLFFSDIEHNQVDQSSLALLRLIAAREERTFARKGHLRKEFDGDFDAALGTLTRRELIEPARGGYRCQVELIRRWFAR
jgi:hypothetical protein